MNTIKRRCRFLTTTIFMLTIYAIGTQQLKAHSNKSSNLDEVIQLLARNYGSINFVYNTKAFKEVVVSDFSPTNNGIENELHQLQQLVPLSYIKKRFTIALKLNKEIEQERIITGTVTDSDNLPIPGASVFVQDTNIGTATDFEGNFTLEVPEDARSLSVTYMGYKKQIVNIENRTEIDIILQTDAASLEEVVLVGYGQTSRETLVDAVSKVDAEQIQQRPIADVSAGLQGLSPGLNVTQSSGDPAAKPRINIRGFTSINGGEPLVIIDGVEGDINNLNPNDIESISVLKDAGASAIYGARGAFGVVLISTKNPKTGNLMVSVDATTAWNSPTVNTDFLTDPYKAVMLVDESFRTAVGRSYTGYNEEDYQNIYEVSQDPSLARVETDIRNGREQYIYYGHTDWWNYFFRDSYPTQIYNVSVSGGSDKIKGFFSYRNYNSEGILKVQDDHYKIYNLRGKLEMKINDWISFTNNMQYNSSNDLKHGGSQYGWGDQFNGNIYVHGLPSYMPQNPDGTATWRTELNNYTIGDGAYASLLYGKAKQETEEGEFSNIATLKLNPVKGLDVTASYAYRRTNYNRYRRSVNIPYSIYPGEVNTMGTDQLTEYNTRFKYDAFNIYGDYHHQIGDHSLKATLGFNQESFYNKSTTASKQNSISDDLNSLGLATSNPEALGSAAEWALQGVFYRLSYDYKDKYLLEVNGRYDGTSRFPEEERWGFFPSVSGGWLINKENFFSSLTDTFNLVKLRASYGSLGNQEVANYAYIPTLRKNIDGNFALNGRTLDYIAAPGLNPREISWEEVKTFDVGTDIALFNNDVNITFDWFQRNTKGMLTQGATLPSVLGTGSPQENAADLRTRGFELSIGYHHSFEVAKSPLNFGIEGNLSNSVTEITKFDNPNNSLLDYYEGMTIGELWGYHVDGLFQTQDEITGHADQTRVSNRIIANGGLQLGDVRYVDLNGDGVIDEGENTLQDSGDRRKIGNTAPQYLYSFRVNAAWKGFDVSAFFQGVGKQDWYPNGDSRIFWAMYNRPYDTFIRKDLVNNIWSPDNREAYFPRLFGYIALSDSDALGAVNDRYLQSVAYLRLKNLSLGYTIPKRITEKFNISKFRIYFSGENLFTFTSLTDYIDPEAASNSVNLNQPSTSANRSTAQTVPFNETYSVGLSLQF